MDSSSSDFPPYGLFGGYMLFDPTCLLLYINKQSHELYMLQGRQPEDPRNKEQAMEMMRFAHERDHLIRHLGTSYGWTRFLLSSFSLDIFNLTVRSGFNTSRKGIFPFAEYRSTSDSFWRELRSHSLQERSELLVEIEKDPFNRFRITYMGCQDLIRAFDGHKHWIGPEFAARMLCLMQDLLGGETVDFKFMPPQSQPSLLRHYNSKHPLVPMLLGGATFGAESLLEFFGCMQELRSAPIDADVSKYSDLIGGISYFRVQQAFMERFPGQHPGWPVEMEIAAELALWIPITPRGIAEQDRRLTWFDLQPGWRFLRIAEFFKESGWSFTYLDDNTTVDRDALTPKIQSEICAALGWPTIEQLATEWVRALADPDKEAPWGSHFDGCNLRFAHGLQLMRQREEWPFSWRLKLSKSPTEPMFSGLVFRDQEVPCRADSEECFNEYHMFTGNQFFAEGFVAHSQVRLEHVKRMHSVLKESLEQLGLADYFESEAMTYMRSQGVAEHLARARL